VTAFVVEVQRLWSRRLVRVVGVALGLSVLLAPPLVDWAFRERARIERDADVERCIQARPPKVRDGVTMATIPASIAPQSERVRRCNDALPPRDGTFHLRELDEVLRPIGALLVVAAFMIGASAIGADWQAGFIATLLTWESRRSRVLLAKVAAVAVTVVGGVLLWEALLAGVLAPFASARDALDGTGGSWLRTTSALGLRTATLAAAAAVFGLCLANLGRSTAAALGGGLSYVLVLESVLGSYFKPLRPWLIIDNAIVFMKGQFEGGPGGDVPGRTVTAAALILAAYLVVLVGGTLTVFRQRDVT